MKTLQFIKLFLISVLFTGFGLTSCVEPEVEQTDYYKVMTTYMAAHNMDLNNVGTDWVIAGQALYDAGVANYSILDLRTAADFAAGHIQGATNCTLGEVVTKAQATTKPIVLVCYTGQTAAWAHVALRLSGYSTCKILKWGMSGWNSSLDKWTANVSNQAEGNANWSTTNTIKTPVSFALPSFTANDTTGAGILAERVQLMLNKGFTGVASADVLANPGNYFINNYWTEADVNTYGHIKGAYRLNETLTLANDGFKNLDPSAKICTYCWTGQTSSLVTAYLTVLGYDAISLKFGANSMINGQLQKNKWAPTTLALPVVQ